MKITILGMPPTINQMYATVRGLRVKTKDARNYSLWARDFVLKSGIKKEDILKLKDQELMVRIFVYSNWYTKDKRHAIKKKDLASYEKAITDSIFSTLDEIAGNVGFDDKQIFISVMRKVNIENSELPKVIYEITPYTFK